MDEVSERLGMHQPMLENHIEDMFRCLGHGLTEPVADLPDILMDLGNRRPVTLFIGWNNAKRGIDTKCKQAVEFLAHRTFAKTCMSNLIPVKGLQVAQVKQQTVAFRNRTIVECLWHHTVKE
jgi:hypothetical protein